MPLESTLFAFALVSLGVAAMPGPSSLFLLAHGIGHGRRAAVAAVAGVSTAAAIRVLLTAAGLSALLTSSVVAFGIIRWAGVAYLLYLGVRTFRSAPLQPAAASVERRTHLGRSAVRGLAVGLGNPKMLIFFVAFFPQFVDPARGSAAVQILVLGAIFWTIGVVWDLAFALLSGSIGRWLERRPRIRAAQPRMQGAIYLGLAAWAAATGSRPE